MPRYNNSSPIQVSGLMRGPAQPSTLEAMGTNHRPDKLWPLRTKALGRRPAQAPARSAWAVIGTVIAVVLAIGGLVVVGAAVMASVALSHTGGK
jgi:hypothetical protein